LPHVRAQAFERSLQDIWLAGTEAAQAEGRDCTVTDYLRELDGLEYRQVVKFADPSGGRPIGIRPTRVCNGLGTYGPGLSVWAASGRVWTPHTRMAVAGALAYPRRRALLSRSGGLNRRCAVARSTRSSRASSRPPS
jgi:hypothetical protein